MENDNEVWKDIPGYEGYQVSNLGRVKSIKKRLHSYFESEIDAYNFYSSKLLWLGL